MSIPTYEELVKVVLARSAPNLSADAVYAVFGIRPRSVSERMAALGPRVTEVCLCKMATCALCNGGCDEDKGAEP